MRGKCAQCSFWGIISVPNYKNASCEAWRMQLQEDERERQIQFNTESSILQTQLNIMAKGQAVDDQPCTPLGELRQPEMPQLPAWCISGRGEALAKCQAPGC